MREVDRAKRAHNQLARALDGRPGITGVWLEPPDGRWTIRVGIMADTVDARRGVPVEVDGVPVEVTVTGPPIVGLVVPTEEPDPGSST